MTLLKTMARRRPADLLLAAEALMLLGAFRAGLAVVPVQRILRAVLKKRAEDKEDRSMGEHKVSQDGHAQADSAQLVRRIAWAVSAASRHSPVELVCFPQALAGHTMLRRRGVRSTLVYGVARSAEGELMAHAWLMAGKTIVTGGDAEREFTAIERWE